MSFLLHQKKTTNPTVYQEPARKKKRKQLSFLVGLLHESPFFFISKALIFKPGRDYLPKQPYSQPLQLFSCVPFDIFLINIYIYIFFLQSITSVKKINIYKLHYNSIQSIKKKRILLLLFLIIDIIIIQYSYIISTIYTQK